MFDNALDVIDDIFSDFATFASDFVGNALPILMSALGALVTIVGVWYGTRAVIRAMRSAGK